MTIINDDEDFVVVYMELDEIEEAQAMLQFRLHHELLNLYVHHVGKYADEFTTISIQMIWGSYMRNKN